MVIRRISLALAQLHNEIQFLISWKFKNFHQKYNAQEDFPLNYRVIEDFSPVMEILIQYKKAQKSSTFFLLEDILKKFSEDFLLNCGGKCSTLFSFSTHINQSFLSPFRRSQNFRTLTIFIQSMKRCPLQNRSNGVCTVCIGEVDEKKSNQQTLTRKQKRLTPFNGDGHWDGVTR